MGRVREAFLPYFVPSIGKEEVSAVIKTLESGWITTGEKTHLFEQEFSTLLGANASLALNSCTAALHLALLLSDVQPGDEVITTPFTFIATSNVIEHLHATPVFVDIEEDTLNIDPTKIEEKITKKTKAILIVHYGGHACDMEQIMAIAGKYSLPVIEDAAHGLGGEYRGKPLGTFGDFSAFSFYANKNITTIEGGMLVGKNVASVERARILSLHGIDRDAWKRYRQEGSWQYEVVYPGLKYNMTDVSASIGLCQLKKLNGFQQTRANIAQEYNKAFCAIPSLKTPITRDGVKHAWFNYALRLDLDQMSIDRSEFIAALKKRQIGITVHFIPVHLHPYYRDKYRYAPRDFPLSYQAYQELFCLPLYPSMTRADVERVIHAVQDITTEHVRR